MLIEHMYRAAEGGYKVAVYRETKSGDGYRKLVEYGEGTPLDVGILWTKRRTYAVLWGVRGRRSETAEVAAAVQRVLESAQEEQEWPEEMPERERRQVIPGDGKCLYWALGTVDGAGGQAAAEEVRRALTEGDMARPPELGWAQRVMRDAGVRTWDQYLDKVRRGEIWGGACEVGRWVQSKGCRVAMYQEWGPRGVHRIMAEVGEGKRTAAVLLWSRRGVIQSLPLPYMKMQGRLSRRWRLQLAAKGAAGCHHGPLRPHWLMVFLWVFLVPPF